jgi:hypothetical protein
LNAGLGTYISWQHVVLLSSEFDIPFVVTDYAEVCLVDAHLDALQQILTSTFPVPKDAEHIRLQVRCSLSRPVTHLICSQVVLKKVLEEVQIMDVEKVCAALKRDRPARLNELMQPGYRGDMSKRIHGARNACIQVITPVAKNVEVIVVEK